MRFLYLLVICFFFQISNCFSQAEITDLKFNKKYFQAIDEWVVFPKKEKDSTYLYGFIYVDQTAGFTFNVESSFQIKKGKFIVKEDSLKGTYYIKHRLDSKYNKLNLAILNKLQLEVLNLPRSPKWLEGYNTNKSSVAFLKNIGYQLNHVGASEEAITYLLKAYDIDPKFKGLYFELSFAYNATRQFEKAKSILLEAINYDSERLLYYKELMFSYMNLRNNSEAEKATLKGLSLKGEDDIKAEMALNMTSVFFNLKEYNSFEKWLLITKKYQTTNASIKAYVNTFERELEKIKNN